jgi:hypothetical protein
MSSQQSNMETIHGRELFETGDYERLINVLSELRKPAEQSEVLRRAA